MALLATLVVLAILIALTASLAFAVRTESLLAAGEERRVQAQWLAESGLQRAVLQLRDRPERYISLVAEADSGQPVVLHLDSTDEPELAPQGEGFTVEGLDESARMDINEVPEQLLTKLLPQEPELVDAILDWRDTDDLPRAEGAEADYYTTLQPPHAPRNGPVETVEELLLVKGITPARFFGATGLSPLADQSEREQVDPLLTPLAELFSVDTFEDNVDGAGQTRIDLTTATAQALLQAFGDDLTEAEATSIANWAKESARGNAGPTTDPNTGLPTAPASPASGTPAMPETNAPTPPGLDTGADSAEADPTPPGGAAKPVAGLLRVLDRAKLQKIYDRLTMSSDQRVLGLVNLNTAAPEILAVLPGMDEATAQAVVQAREQTPFETVGDLLGLTEVTNEQFERVAPWLTTRGQTVKLVATGWVGQGQEAVQRRVTAVVLVEMARTASAADPGAAGTTSAETATDGQESTTPTRTVRLVYHRVD